MSNYLRSVFSTSLSRGRLSYFLNGLALVSLAVVGIFAGFAIAALDGPSTAFLGVLVGAVAVVFAIVGQGFLFAQRVRDLGLPVAFVVASYYVVSTVGGALTAANETAAIVLSLGTLIFSLYILLIPGKSSRTTDVPGSAAIA